MSTKHNWANSRQCCIFVFCILLHSTILQFYILTLDQCIKKPTNTKRCTYTYVFCFVFFICGDCSMPANSIKKMFTLSIVAVAQPWKEQTDALWKCRLCFLPFCFYFSHFAAEKHSNGNSSGANYEILSLITLMCDLCSDPHCGLEVWIKSIAFPKTCSTCADEV